MDSFTDTLIIDTSYNLNSNNRHSVLLNQCSLSGEWQNWIFNSLDPDHAPLGTYSRYWMGFRILFRPLLMLGDYLMIRKLMAFVFFSLLVLMEVCISDKRGPATAFLFGFSIILVNPAIISHCLQYVCDFILAFVFSITVLYNNRDNKAPALFCLFGALTQYFDFYTVPIITFAFPALLVLSNERLSAKQLWKKSCILFLCWFYGYVILWIIKNLYVTLFTSENGLRLAYSSFASRIGINKGVLSQDLFSPVIALQSVWINVFSYKYSKLFLLILAAAIILSTYLTAKKGFAQVMRSSVFLGIAALPVLWIICAAQPTIVHSYFQYRGISAFIAGCGMYIAQPFITKNQPEHEDILKQAD